MDSALTGEARSAVDALGGADLLVGIPSYNNATTIGHVVETAAAGLVRHFPDLRAAIFNGDGGSSDGTPAAVLDARVPTAVRVLTFPYLGLPGKGSAFHAIFEAATRLGVRACVVLDSDLRSVTPEWVARLAGAIVDGEADYVTPLYTRHKYDGTITNNLAYPVTRALYGVRVRQPNGGDYGIGADVLRTYVAQDVWQTDVARFGIDIWMTTTALAGGSRVQQAVLGTKVHDPKDPAASLGPMFMQVVGTLFGLMERYSDRWWDVAGSVPAAARGAPVAGEPEPVAVSREALVERFRAGLDAHDADWQRVLAPETYAAVVALAAQADARFTFPAEPWVRVVYDFAAAYGHGAASPAALMDALTPLYFGRTAGLVLDTLPMDTAAFEVYLEAQADIFEREKPYLRERWQTATEGARRP
jgi:hypothetical protein